MARVRGAGGFFGFALVLLLKALAILAMVGAPLLGVWVASSIAALRNGPMWLPVLCGLLLFPLLPVLWEAWSAWSRSRKSKPKPRLLTTIDRLILRTLLLSAAFLASLLLAQPSAAFTALSARGDWMLQGRKDARANALRAGLFNVANHLEWLYLAVHENPFRKYKTQEPTPEPTPQATATATASSAPAVSSGPPILPVPSSSATPAPTEAPPPPAPPPELDSWHLPGELHPAVTNMAPGSESSIRALAEFLTARVPAPLERLKALHDWVADRVSYDAPALAAGKFPPQDAETVFRTRRSVCAGYAQLLSALGRAAGLEVVYVTGNARTEANDLSGIGHAWNAARIGSEWYLIDATWDSGTVAGLHFERRYSTEYFLTPARIFGVDHFPDEAKWQLLKKPLSRGEFLRQPALSPRFFASGLELLAPDRSQVDVQGELAIAIRNPLGVFLLATLSPRGSEPGPPADCQVENGQSTRVTCRFPRPGRYDVQLFTNRQEFGTFTFAGQLQANSG